GVRANPSRSRGAVFSRPSYEQASPKNDTAPRPSSEPLGVDYPNGSRSGTAHERTDGKRKGSRTPTDAGLPACLAASAHPAGRARLSAFHGGSALGTHASQGAASDQVSRGWRLDGGVSRRRQPRLQRAPRTPVIVPADMMSDTARVQRGRTLCARAPHLAPASRSHR